MDKRFGTAAVLGQVFSDPLLHVADVELDLLSFLGHELDLTHQLALDLLKPFLRLLHLLLVSNQTSQLVD
jgi:hypothetical protein